MNTLDLYHLIAVAAMEMESVHRINRQVLIIALKKSNPEDATPNDIWERTDRFAEYVKANTNWAERNQHHFNILSEAGKQIYWGICCEFAREMVMNPEYRPIAHFCRIFDEMCEAREIKQTTDLLSRLGIKENLN